MTSQDFFLRATAAFSTVSMRTTYAGRTLVLLGAVSISTQSINAQSVERVTLNSRNISLYNLVGRITVTGGGTSASAVITRRGRDASRLTVATGMIDGREALRVIYPSDRITVPDTRERRLRSEMRVRDDGTFGNRYSEGNGKRVSIRFNDGRRVRIGGESGGLEASADVELQVPTGVSVRLHLGIGEMNVTNVRGDIAIDVSGANVQTTDTQGTLSIDTGSGDATITNASGIITLDTGSGNVHGRNISGTGLLIDSGSGNVTLEGCSSEKVSVDTGSGDLRVTNMTARSLALDTGSGEVVLGLRNSPDIITIDSGSGDVTLTLPSDYGAMLDIDTGSGGISSDFALTVSSKSRDQMRGRVGNGNGRLIVETGSGSVRLRKGS